MTASLRISILSFFILLSGCVSVGLPKTKPMRSTSYKHQVPPEPFQIREGFDTDHVYQSRSTGNSLVIMSECNPALESSAEQLISDSFSILTNPKPYKVHRIETNNRTGYRSKVEGEVDGVQTFHEIFVFQKDGCSYILSYVGAQKNYAKEVSFYETFISGFTVP